MWEFEESCKKDPDDEESTDDSLILDEEYLPQAKPKKQFSCKFCKLKFSQKSHRASHFLNSHKDIPGVEDLISNKIHSCKLCDYRTISCNNLEFHELAKHKIKHEKTTKNLHCLYCNYSTNNKGNLMIHSRRHTNIKLFDCQYCEHSCNQKSNLDAHYLLKHRFESEVESLITSKVYKCKLCEFKTLNKTKHGRHMSECCITGFFREIPDNVRIKAEHCEN